MKNIALISVLCCFISFPLFANEKHLSNHYNANEISKLHINNGVGDIQIEVTDADQITVDVQVRGSKSWFFGRTDVSDAQLESSQKNGKLSLEVPLDDTEQNWVVKVPRQLALTLQLGVGSIQLDGNAGDIDADIGVGSFSAKLAVPEYKNIELSAGVGEVNLDQTSGKTERSHLVGGDLEYTGPGKHAMSITVGVGDASVSNTVL